MKLQLAESQYLLYIQSDITPAGALRSARSAWLRRSWWAEHLARMEKHGEDVDSFDWLNDRGRVGG
jgi:hypothetical protein